MICYHFINLNNRTHTESMKCYDHLQLYCTCTCIKYCVSILNILYISLILRWIPSDLFPLNKFMINETEVVALPIRSRYIFKHGFCSHHLLILNKKKRTIGFDFEIFPLFLFKEPEVYFNHLTLVIFFFFFFFCFVCLKFSKWSNLFETICHFKDGWLLVTFQWL